MLGTSKNIWGFDPRSVPGCQLWLDAADQSSMTFSGSTITQWNDKSGNGYNSVSTGTPTYVTGGGVNFNGSSYFLNQAFTMNLSQRSIFIVMQETSRTIYSGILTFIPTATSGSDFFSVETTNGFNFHGAAYDSVLGNSSLIAKGIYNDNMNVTTGSGYFNGTNATNVTAGAVEATCSGYGIGGRWLNGSMSGSYRLNGIIYEIIIFNTALTTSQRQQVEGYLANKWGLTTPIPLTHPFKSIRPHLRTFQPTDIPGCQLWLDGADSSTITLSTTKVTQWNDKSGNGYNFTQSTSGNQPTYSVASLNNQNTITFTSANSTYLLGTASTNFIGTNSLSMYGVFKTNNATSGASVFAKSLYGGASGRILYGYRDPGTPGMIVFANSDGIAHDIPDTYTPGAWRMVGFVSDRSGWTNITYQNGVVAATKTISADTTTNLTNGFPMLVGAYNNSSGGADPPQADRYLDGAVGELLVFSTALTTSQRQQVEGYLAHKWGLTTPIPSTHPFKSFPPAKAPMIIGLVNRWIFNNGSGSTVTDTVGGQNISLSGTYTWSSSVPNSEIALGSLSFNGYTGTGSASVNTTLQTSTYTMTLWYYHTGVSDPYGGNPMILQSGFNQNEAFSFATGGFTGTSKPYFYSGVYNGGFFRQFSSATPLNTWTHLAVTIGNSRYNAYQNGVLDSGNTNISITSGLPLTLNGSFIFAKGDSAYGNRFGGSLFDVRIYNRALSASEISQIYNGIG